MALAIAYFGTNGYTISIPLNDTQWYDLIVEKMVYFKLFNVNLPQVKLMKFLCVQRVVLMEQFMTMY